LRYNAKKQTDTQTDGLEKPTPGTVGGIRNYSEKYTYIQSFLSAFFVSFLVVLVHSPMCF